MNQGKLLEKARVIVEHCLQVKPGEQVLIIQDGTLSENIIKAVWAASFNVDAKTQILQYTPYRYIPEKEYCLFAGTSLRKEDVEPPRSLSASMMASDAVIMLMSDMDIIFAKALKEALVEGTRIIFIPYLSEEEIVRLLPSSKGEVEELRGTVERVAQIFDESHTARVTSLGGTDISTKIGEYNTLPHLGVAEPGSMQILPAGQITKVPNDESSEGVLVIDRSIAAYEYKELSDPIIMTVKKGNVVEIEGGNDAEALRRFLAKMEDPNMYHLTELATGVNPRCKFAGIAPPAEDTHTLGCVSMALGCDVHLGGSVKAKAHIDMTMRYASLILDKKTIVEKGRLKL